MLIIGVSRSGKTKAFLKLINNQPDIEDVEDVEDPYEVKYQYLINEREKTDLKHLNDPKALIEYSNDM